MSPNSKGITFSLTDQAELQKLLPQHFGLLRNFKDESGRGIKRGAVSQMLAETQPKV